MAKVLVISMTKELDDAVYQAEINELEDYYEHLECRCLDVANRKIGNKRFDIWVDDEGLLKDKPVLSAVRFIKDTEEWEPMLAGNLIIANHDGAGNTTSLTRDEVAMIMDNILVRVLDDERMIPCLVCEY